VQIGQLSITKAFSLSVRFSINSTNPAINGDFNLNSDVSGDPAKEMYLLKQLKLTSTLNDKTYANGKLTLALQGDIKADLQNETLTIDALNAKVANLQVQGNLQEQKILSDLQLQGQIKVPQFNLKQFLAAIGHPQSATQNPNALTQADFSGAIQATANSLRINKLIAQLDNSHINGNLAITDFIKKALAFTINVDELNVDHYRAPAAVTTANNNNHVSANNNVSPQHNTQPLFPVDSLRQLNLQGQLKIGRLHFSKIDASAVSMQIKALNGLINLAPLSAKLYQGNYNGDITVDVRGKTPVITTNTTLNSIQIEPLLRDAANITKLQMTGVGNLKMRLTMQGNNEAALINHLNGQGRLSLSNGAVKGINIPYWVGVGRALINKEAPPAASGSNQTSFGNLTGSFTITNGVMNNNDLLIDAPTFQAKGSGSANLVSQYLDYKLIAQLIAPDARKPQGDALPIKISGNFNNISIRPLVEEIIKQKLRDQVKKQVEDKVTSQLQKSLGDETGKAVGDKLNSVLQQFLQ